MGQGYVRNDTSNNIDANKVASAADIDGEFDAIVAAFNASTGHTHDGTAAEGAPITVIGPSQEYIADGTSFKPKVNNTYDLGTSSVKWKDLYLSGNLSIVELTTDAATVNGNIIVTGTVDGRNVASDGTKLDTIEANADVTDTDNVTSAGALMDSELTNITAVKGLDQGVSTTDSPTFADLTLSGNLSVEDVDEATSTLSGTTPSLDVSSSQDFTLTTSGNTTVTLTNTPTGRAWVRTLTVTFGGAHTLAITSANWGDVGAPTAASGDVIVIQLWGVGSSFKALEVWRDTA